MKLKLLRERCQDWDQNVFGDIQSKKEEILKRDRFFR